jgi:integrase
LCDLQWSQVELATGRLHVRRAKNGSPSVHPMHGDEIRALRRLQREQGLSSHVFMTERDGPMTPKAFHALFGRIGERAKMPFPIHSHMLRHGCGYALANAGHDTRALQAWLGHKNIQHAVRYTELASGADQSAFEAAIMTPGGWENGAIETAWSVPLSLVPFLERDEALGKGRW